MSTSSRARSIFVLIVLSFSSLACSSKPERLEPPPPKVTVGKPVERVITDYFEYNGRIEAKSVEVRARVRGHVIKIHFDDGQDVAKGDPLFDLDPEPFQNEIARAQEQKNIYAAQKNAAELQVQVLEKLKTIKSASDVEIAKAKADVKSLDAQIQASEQEVQRQKIELGYSKVTAPIAGQISDAKVQEGDLVNAGGSDPLLAVIVPLERLYVAFYVDERTAQKYAKTNDGRRGKEYRLKNEKFSFEFKLDSDSEFVHGGILDYVDPNVDPGTGTIKVRGEINVKETSPRFVPGYRARVRIPVPTEKGKSVQFKALFVPDTAILSDLTKKYVLVVDGQNVVHRRDVLPGELTGDGLRVIKPDKEGKTGITADDRIILQGLLSARINYPVEPIPADAK